MGNRRSFLKGLSSAPVLGWLLRGTTTYSQSSARDLLKELGVRPFINAAGTYTTMTGSLMLPEVMDAINYGAKHYVMLDELHDAVGARIASLIGCEAAMVTAGAASALTLGTAGVVTRGERQLVEKVPDLTGMKNEVIVQKSHRFAYDHGVRNVGVRLVEVETRRELEAAINEKTAMLFFLNFGNNAGRIKDVEFVELGKKHGIPTFNDCAADVHPPENISKWTKMGFDLVCFSGGKALFGPQSAGLLLGRADLIAAARRNGSPSANTIGRGMKVNKEEMLGMLVAIERWMTIDHEAIWRDWEQRAERIVAAARSIPDVTAEVYLPEIYNRWPHITVSWNEERLGKKRREVMQALRDGEPSIMVQNDPRGIDVGVITLRPGEDAIVARRLRQVLGGSA